MSKPVMTVLGAGNGGLALAGDLTVKGNKVRLYEHPDFVAAISELQLKPELTMIDAAGREVRVALDAVTDRIERAVDGAELVHLVVPVSAQETFFRILFPVLGPEHCLVMWAGRFGSLRLRKMAHEAGIPDERIKAIEVNTLPFGSRRISGTQVRIAFHATRMFASGHPDWATQDALRRLAADFPVLKVVESVIEVALRNSSMLVLGVGPLLNVGAIETMQGEFALFRDGMTPGVRRVVRAAHQEIIAVGEGWGVAIEPYEDAVYDHPTSVEGANFRDPGGGYEGFALLTGPDRLVHRYTIENVRYGFAVVSELGRRRGVKTPVLDALTVLAGAICGEAFGALGWKLEDLAIA